MTITQTVEIPADRRLIIEVPREIPAGKAILTFTPATDAAALHDCPICAKNCDPITGNPSYNAEAVKAIEEGIAISNGEIPAKRFNSLADMLKDLERDNAQPLYPNA